MIDLYVDTDMNVQGVCVCMYCFIIVFDSTSYGVPFG